MRISTKGIYALEIVADLAMHSTEDSWESLKNIANRRNLSEKYLERIMKGLKDNVKFGGAGLVMSILGGSVIPPVQAAIMDVKGGFCGWSFINLSFFVPVVCFLVVAWYGWRTFKA